MTTGVIDVYSIVLKDSVISIYCVMEKNMLE